MPEELRREESQESNPFQEEPRVAAEPNLEAPAPAAETGPGGERQSEQRDLEFLMRRIQSASGQSAQPADFQSDAQKLSEADEQARVQQLVTLAEAKGVEHAVRVARSLNDFYALDLLHDELVERLHALLDKEAAKGR